MERRWHLMQTRPGLVLLPPPKMSGDLCVAGQPPTSDPQAAEAGGARVEDNLHRCLYVGTPWEAEVVTDYHDIEEFKEASCMIGRVLSVRVLG
jgi:hypothetical protein